MFVIAYGLFGGLLDVWWGLLLVTWWVLAFLVVGFVVVVLFAVSG